MPPEAGRGGTTTASRCDEAVDLAPALLGHEQACEALRRGMPWCTGIRWCRRERHDSSRAWQRPIGRSLENDQVIARDRSSFPPLLSGQKPNSSEQAAVLPFLAYEHDPEKWTAVFGKGHAPPKK
jgi:hypothetical protein